MKIKQVNNLSNEEYHNSEKYHDYWSSSNLKKYLETPREAYYQKFIAEKKEQSDALIFGNQLHDFLASKHFRGQPFEYNVFEPTPNPKTGKPYGKTANAYLQQLEQIKNPITSNDFEVISDIWAMIKHSDYGWFFEQQILSKGIAEPSFFIELGIHKYKYRPDVVTDKYIFDYKTIAKKTGFKSNWNEQKLKYRISDLEYDISAAMYQYFEHERTGIWKPFIIIWIMKDPPYDVLISDISQYCFEPIGNGETVVNSAANVFLSLKDQHELCQVSENWPGLANQFNKFRGVRIAEFAPRFENYFEQFEID